MARFNLNEYSRTELPNTPCDTFRGHIRSQGYGVVTNPGNKKRRAHVVAWEQEHGPVPVGRELHHKCLNRACVNVDHLEPMTKADHVRLHLSDGFTRSKLTPEQVIAIRAARFPGKTLAAFYGVSQGTISMARNGVTWRGVRRAEV